MDIATFHASRRFAETSSGRIAYVEQGHGPVALFVHGVPLNGYHWRYVIDRVADRRRCIAIDLMALGYTEIAPSQEVSFTAQAHMIAQVLDSLGVEKIDLVGNDSGGAIAQIFAAHYPHRLRSLVLTNCDVHDGWPPHQILPVIERARRGTLAAIYQPLLDRPDLAIARHASGESVPLLRCWADPGVVSEDTIRVYLAPLLSSSERVDAFHRYWLGFDNAQTVAIYPRLRALHVPTLIVWALEDFFFDRKWAYWLKETIPGVRRVVEVARGRLFFPEDLPDSLTVPMVQFWSELSQEAL